MVGQSARLQRPSLIRCVSIAAIARTFAVIVLVFYVHVFVVELFVVGVLETVVIFFHVRHLFVCDTATARARGTGRRRTRRRARTRMRSLEPLRFVHSRCFGRATRACVNE